MSNSELNVAASRMLLQSDGSTTLLLESLVNSSLAVKVTEQGIVGGEHVDSSIRNLLYADKQDDFLERHSMLMTEDHQIVSINYVVAKNVVDPLLTSPQSEEIPLGKLLTVHKLAQYRQLLGYGFGRFLFDGNIQFCSYKHYLIWIHGKPSMYIHETFNPSIVALVHH